MKLIESQLYAVCFKWACSFGTVQLVMINWIYGFNACLEYKVEDSIQLKYIGYILVWMCARFDPTGLIFGTFRQHIFMFNNNNI